MGRDGGGDGARRGRGEADGARTRTGAGRGRRRRTGTAKIYNIKINVICVRGRPH